MNPRILLAAVLLSTACVKLDADLPPICGSTSVSVPGTGSLTPLAAGLSVSVTQSFAFGAGTDMSYLTQVLLNGGSLTPGGGISDFSFVDTAQLTVLPPSGSSLQPVILLDWQKGSSSAASIAIPAAAANLKDYFSDQGFQIQLTISGQPPAQAWGVNVDICASADVDETVSL
jgi:hypothetical protein